MARSLMRATMLDIFIKNRMSIFCVASIYQRPNSVANSGRKFYSHYNFSNPFSTVTQERLSWEGSCHANVLQRLQMCLKEHQVDEALEAYNDFRRLYGLPSETLVNQLITELCYSSEPKWLQTAFSITISLSKEKSFLLKPELLTKLSISLARAQMPVPASRILRLILQENLIPKSLFGSIILHMVKTEIGTYLASNILVEICDRFLNLTSKRSLHAHLIRPDTMIFNLVLNACIRFNSTFKGMQIIELMALSGIVGDAHTIVAISRIHEINGQRDELKSLKECVDLWSVSLMHHYHLFYNNMLSLHFKYDDIDSATELILDMKSLRSLPERKGPQKPIFIPIGSHNLRQGLKLQISPQLLQKEFMPIETKEECLVYRNGKLSLSNKGLGKLIMLYKSHGKIRDLSNFLICINNSRGPFVVDNLCSDVLSACIHMGWLNVAHDILEDLEAEGTLLSITSYTSLLTAYHKANMHKEAQTLLNQMRKAGLAITEEMVSPDNLSEAVDSEKPALALALLRELRDRENVLPAVVYEFDSSIYFFMKAKMIDDASKTYRKMQDVNIQPGVTTFMYMVMGYSSLGMYREISILWGDMKRNSDKGNSVHNRDLYEFLVLNFLRAGYFERVMEVIGCMTKCGMYTDKMFYKSEFLKFHRGLYRNLKAFDATTEAQSKRLEHVRAFRKWVGNWH